MSDPMFVIKILDLHWINNIDDGNDLCAHGHLFLKIGDQVLSDWNSGDWTLSSAALSLLRTIDRNYVKSENSNQLIPHCGHFFIPDEKGEEVVILGCNTGIDWKVIHASNNKIKHILENGYEITMDRDVYERIVFDFTDQIDTFFKTSKPRNLPKDKFDKKGYLSFWKEWRSYRDK
jgi:hypothetical protein